MKNLTVELKDIYEEQNPDKKRELAVRLIENSHAKKTTKNQALFLVRSKLDSRNIDKFMTNYVLSGEGMKVS
jgi:hypothetical protein